MDHRELLKNFYLFTAATANDLRALEAIGEPRVCIAGDLVYNAGQVADALFLIEMGTVDIMPMGKETVFATMWSGQGFGELAFSHRCSPSGPNSRSSCIGTPVRFLRNTYAGWHSP